AGRRGGARRDAGERGGQRDLGGDRAARRVGAHRRGVRRTRMHRALPEWRRELVFHGRLRRPPREGGCSPRWRRAARAGLVQRGLLRPRTLRRGRLRRRCGLGTTSAAALLLARALARRELEAVAAGVLPHERGRERAAEARCEVGEQLGLALAQVVIGLFARDLALAHRARQDEAAALRRAVLLALLALLARELVL